MSRATYYRHRTKESHQGSLVSYIAYRDNGIHIKQWSDNYRRASIRTLEDYLYTFDTVSVEKVTRYIEEVPKAQYSKRKNRHNALSAYARYLCEIKGVLRQSDYKKIRELYPKKPIGYRPKQTILTDKEMSVLISEATMNQRSLVVFYSETGLRLQELVDLDFSKDLIYTPKPYIQVRHGKGDKDRIVPFPQDARRAIEVLAKVSLERSAIVSCLKRLSRRTGIHFSCHSLRHYRASKWANDPQIPITVTKAWLGHSDLKTTMRYVHNDGYEYLY